MKGLARHTREQRKQVALSIVEELRSALGERMLACAAQASFARGQDAAYSDLEMIVIVDEIPDGKLWCGLGVIRDGMLIEVVATTQAGYVAMVKAVTKDWYIAGSDKLMALYGEEVIAALNAVPTPPSHKECLQQAKERWYNLQEAASKVLNAKLARNVEGMPLLLNDFYQEVLIILSYLNAKPYTTFSQFVAESKQFKVRPVALTELDAFLAAPKYNDFAMIELMVRGVFQQLELILQQLGVELYPEVDIVSRIRDQI